MQNTQELRGVKVLLGISIALLIVSIAINVATLAVVATQNSIVVSNIYPTAPVVYVYATGTPEPNVPVQITDPAITQSPSDASIVELMECDEPKQEICYYPPEIGNGKMIISVWVRNLDTRSVPYVTIGAADFNCVPSNAASNTIICTGSKVQNQEWLIQVSSPEGNILASGRISVNFGSSSPASTSDNRPASGEESSDESSDDSSSEVSSTDEPTDVPTDEPTDIPTDDVSYP